jgi:REP element-mobilizing transposase RayT
MSYPPRPLICGGTYFISSRCLNFEPILKRSDIKDIVLSCISKAQAKYEFELSAFGVFDEQFKLTIRTLNDTDTISKIMQHIKSNITRMVNRRIGRTGTIWNERFMSTVVRCISETADYIRKSLILTSGEYRDGRFIPCLRKYCSLACYTGAGSAGLSVTLHAAFLDLGGTMEKQIRRFSEIVKRVATEGFNPD